MKTYISITGVVFVFLAVAHIARVVEEGTHLLREPIFLATSIMSIGISIWAAILLYRSTRRS